MDLVFIRPPGVQPGGFVLTPDPVWYCSVLLLFSASALTDTESKSFDCAFVLTLETYRDPENGNYSNYFNYFNYLTLNIRPVDWLDSVGSRILYELDPKNPILNALPIENIIGKRPVVPYGDPGTKCLMETQELYLSTSLDMPFQALAETVSRGLGMAAGCGM